MEGIEQPTLFISHGGGPWPWIEEMRPLYKKTETALKELGHKLNPKAILVISGHWEERDFTVSTSDHPSMIYDYSGFPDHTYHIKYGAPSSPELAKKVKKLIQQGGIKINEDPRRGFDHGTFVPLSLMFPAANIPVVQLSIKSNYSSLEHFQVGKLLSSLRQEGVLILASGLSYHNMRGFFGGGGPASEIFEEWLTHTIESSPEVRNKLLLNWEQAPKARDAHPQEDHLVPLFVALGAAHEDSGKKLLSDQVMGISMASYQFG